MKTTKTERRNKAYNVIIKFSCCITIITLLLNAGIVSGQIDFKLKYKDKGGNPSWDTGGESLIKIMEAATKHWASFYPGASHKVKITYYWDDRDRGIGLSSFDASWDDLAGTRRKLGIATPNSYRIRFYTVDGVSLTSGKTEINWYFDRTPTENSEYQMEPVLIGTSGSSGPFYSGSPNDFLEIGYAGNKRDSGADTYDLFTAALHEIGHTLGLGDRKKKEAKIDGDYDIPGLSSGSYPWSGFGVMAMLDGMGHVDPGHIADDMSPCLMSYGVANNQRILPSEADILVIASINNYPTVDFPRTYSGSGATPPGSAIAWTDPSNWHVDIPSSDKSFGIMHMGNPDVYLVGTGEGKNGFIDITGLLQIKDKTLILTYDLEMREDSRIEITSGSLSANNIFHNGELIEVSSSGGLGISNLLEVGAEGIVSLMGSRTNYAEIIAPEATIDLNNAELFVSNVKGDISALNNNGTLSLIHGGNSILSSIHRFHNDGTIRAENGDIFLNFGSWPDIVFDLDGDESPIGIEFGVVDASSGSIMFSLGPSEEFNSDIIVGFSNAVGFGTGITIGNNGTVSLIGSDFSSPEITVIDGGSFSVSESTTPSRIQGNQVWNNLGHAEVAANSVLKIYGETTFNGGRHYTGNGVIVQNGDIIVDSETLCEINISDFDWNGDVTGITSNITITTGSHLLINGSLLPAFEGIITIEEDGTLQITRDWQLDGSLILNNGIILGGDVYNNGIITGEGHCEITISGPGTVVETGSGIDCYP